MDISSLPRNSADPELGIAHQHPLLSILHLSNLISYDQLNSKMDSSKLQRQAAYMKKSLFDQGYLDEQFYQLEELQDEVSPNFVEEVVTLFIKDSSRVLSNLEQALEKCPQDFHKLDAYMHQFQGSASSVGAFRVKNECALFQGHCEEENIEGCLKSFQKVKREHNVLRQKLEAYLQLLKQVGPVPRRN